MGCVTSRSRYRRILDSDGNTNVLLEIGKGGTRGRYWFRFEIPNEMAPKVTPANAPYTTEKLPLAPTGQGTGHRYYDRSKSALKAAQTLLADFRESRYQQWQEMSKDVNFSLFKHLTRGQFIATCSTEGVFAHEVAFEFWNTDEASKMEWDTSVDTCTVLESISPSCSIVHITTKTIWPLKARDVVICTELLRIAHGTYAVCNYSVNEYSSPLIATGNYLRADTSVVLIVEQHLKNPNGGFERDNVQSEIFYQADIDPGGWIPSNLVNTIARREWKVTLLSLCKNVHKRAEKDMNSEKEGFNEDEELFFDSHEQYVIEI